MRTPSKLLLGFLLTLAGTSGFGTAQAAAITNLDDKPQRFEIEINGQRQPLVIAPNATWRAVGRVRVFKDDREVSIDTAEEYAIWKDGTFGPQRNKSNTLRRFE